MAPAIDAAFVQTEEHRPKTSVTVAGGIPLIDLSVLHKSDDHLPGLASSEIAGGLVAQIESACMDWGFFQVVNHGVPSKVQDALEAAARQFFNLPAEEKRKVRRDEVNPLGYYDTEHTKNVRDWKEVLDFAVQDPTFIPAHTAAHPGNDELQELRNQWPEYPPELRESAMQYGKAMEKLAFQLLELISLSLGLPAQRLNGFFKDQTTFIRLNHYPPCPSPELALGVGRHKDGGALTILFQDDVGGLDVKCKSSGEWVRVKPIPGSYIINVGDIIQVWSNDKYESAEHRVTVNSERDRISIPYFFNPAHYTVVKPLEELVTADKPAKYKAYRWGHFFKARKDSNFQKLKEENIQIYHFRVVDIE